MAEVAFFISIYAATKSRPLPTYYYLAAIHFFRRIQKKILHTELLSTVGWTSQTWSQQSFHVDKF